MKAAKEVSTCVQIQASAALVLGGIGTFSDCEGQSLSLIEC